MVGGLLAGLGAQGGWRSPQEPLTCPRMGTPGRMCHFHLSTWAPTLNHLRPVCPSDPFHRPPTAASTSLCLVSILMLPQELWSQLLFLENGLLNSTVSLR